MAKQLRKFFVKIALFFKYRAGYKDCHSCGAQATVSFEKDWIFHPDEPPLFGHFRCSECNACTMSKPTGLSEEAVKKMGYKDFNEYGEKVLIPLSERMKEENDR